MGSISDLVQALVKMARAIRSRAIPASGTIALLIVFMASSLWILPAYHHSLGWWYTADIWNYLQLAHLTDIGAYQAIYSQPTISTTPGVVAVLAPVWWIIHAAGMSVSFELRVLRPTAWLVLGPYEVLLSAPALFAVDAVAVRLGASTARRVLICAAEVYALYNVVLWGHPEDAIAVACLLYACLASSEGQWKRAGWWLGVAVAFQPFVLLSLPLLFFLIPRSKLMGFLSRAAMPTCALLVLPLSLDWSVTIHDFVAQATFSTLNRPTPWLRFAPSLGTDGFHGATGVMAAGDGPARLLAVLFAVVLGIVLRRSVHRLDMLVAAVALSLSLWCDFETVIAPYYVWPAIAVALIGLTATSTPRTAATLVFAGIADIASNADLHAEWVWWVIVCALGALVTVSWPIADTHADEDVVPHRPRLAVGVGPISQHDG
jgi:hypothetical protein